MNDCIDHTDILGMTVFNIFKKKIKAFDAADLFFFSVVKSQHF